MQERDADVHDILLAVLPGYVPHIFFIERLSHGAVGAHPLRYLGHKFQGDQRRRFLPEQDGTEASWDGLARDLQHVPETACDNESELLHAL